MLEVKPTTPLKPSRGVMVMVVVPAIPAFTVTPPVGFAQIVKSWTV